MRRQCGTGVWKRRLSSTAFGIRLRWRGLTKFVGREREMEELKQAADLARQGHGQELESRV
jgi:hypothetical protein